MKGTNGREELYNPRPCNTAFFPCIQCRLTSDSQHGLKVLLELLFCSTLCTLCSWCCSSSCSRATLTDSGGNTATTERQLKKRQMTWTTSLITAPSCPSLWKIQGLITWKILETSSELRCCATSHSLAVISIRRQMSMSTFMAFSWIFVSRSVMGCRKDSRDYLLLLHSSGKKRYPTVSLEPQATPVLNSTPCSWQAEHGQSQDSTAHP